MTNGRTLKNSRYVFILGAPNDDLGALSDVSLSRVKSAVSIFQNDRDVRIIVTGGYGDHFNRTHRPHRHYVSDELAKYGVQTETLGYDSFLSSNTVEDAVQIREFVVDQGLWNFEVITSTFHIERCMLVFKCILPDRNIHFHSADDPVDISSLTTHEKSAMLRLKKQGGVIVGKEFFPLNNRQ
ncbi:YdcF family protein [Parasphingorhabdus sp.]